MGPWEIFLLSIFLYFLQIFIKSMFYFITGKNKINKNKQISGCYGERIEWGLHPLASALFQHHIMSRVWQVATGSPARAVPADTQDLLAGSRSHQMPNLEVWQLLNFTKFGFVCLFVCLFATSGYTHTHTHTCTPENMHFSVWGSPWLASLQEAGSQGTWHGLLTGRWSLVHTGIPTPI